MIHTFSFQKSAGEDVPGIITRRLANLALTEWGRASQSEHSRLSIAVVKLTSSGTTWFLVVPKLCRKAGCLKSEIPNYVQQHKVSSSPLPYWHLFLQECPFFVVRSSVCQWPCSLQHLCCALTLNWGEIKMLSLGFPFAGPSCPCCWFGEAVQGALLRLCVWGVVTLCNTNWGCAGQVALGGTQGVVLNRSTGAVTGLETNCGFIPRCCVCLLPWCHCICSIFSTISVLLVLNCKSRQSKSHLQT